MATIAVEHRHELGEEEALRRAHELIRQFGARLKADIQWDGANATFKGSGFSGGAQVSATRLVVTVDLSLVLRPLKGKIESGLEKAMRERFT